MTRNHDALPAQPHVMVLDPDSLPRFSPFLLSTIVTFGSCGAMLGVLSGTEHFLAPIAPLRVVLPLISVATAMAISSATGGAFSALVLLFARSGRPRT